MTSYISPDSGHLVIKSSNDLNLSLIDPADAALHVVGGEYVGGNLYVGGTLVANGDVITLGNAGGNITFNSGISSHVLPSTTDTYDIGATLSKWANVYSVNLHTNQIFISENPTVVTTAIDLTQGINHIDAATAAAVTMADGEEGQLLSIITIDAPLLPVYVTPTSTIGYANLVLTNIGDTAMLVFTNGAWAISNVFRTSVNN